jgi:putative oxidoreductase
MWAFLSRNRDAGLLLLRLALGGFFLWIHGWPKLMGGMEMWPKLGGAMKHVGISFAPAFWGFMAVLAESFGIVLFIIGFAFRPACLLLTFTMVFAGLHSYMTQKNVADGLREASHAWELGIIFFSMMFVGPGKYSLDKQ